MVNTEDFIKRLEAIMDYNAISASVFADKIGIQRSGMSHLMSGRNKPSLDFILKIVDAYPDVDLYWLLKGKGTYPVEKATDIDKLHHSSSPAPVKKNDVPDLFTAPDNSNPEIAKANQQPSLMNTKANIIEGDIERIIIFYKNGTFNEYKPG